MERLNIYEEKVNEIRTKIHNIKFKVDNRAVKPTGKLKFLTAYRFFWREEVPIVKSMYPDLAGKDRHAMVRKRWQNLPDSKKITFVMMSRLDRDRAIYINRLSQIKQNLLEEHPEVTCKNVSNLLVHDKQAAVLYKKRLNELK